MPTPILHNANTAIEERLDALSKELEDHLKCDVLSFLGPLWTGVDGVIREAVEDRRPRRKSLAVLLETDGGYIEVAQRIADTFRRKYRRVEFVIPDHAMSAGTVLVMSGDAIHMDYYAVLGPIDPQVVRRGGGGLIPGLGYLVQYKRLIEKSNKGQLSPAELAFLINKFDPAELYQYEQSRELSKTLLQDWLVKYKFKNWRRTKTRGRQVTRPMRVERAAKIAEDLSDSDRWHSHGRGISMAVLRRVLRLQIDDFGADRELNHKVRQYHKLLVDYMGRRAHVGVTHWPGHYTPFMGASNA